MTNNNEIINNNGVIILKQISPIITFSDTIKELINQALTQHGIAIIDFDGVEAISRSVAHEIAIAINSGKNIKLINCNCNIYKMMQIVFKTMNRRCSCETNCP